MRRRTTVARQKSATLRLSVTRRLGQLYSLEITLLRANRVACRVPVELQWHLPDREPEEVRWYLEDFLDEGGAPARVRAKRAREILHRWGTELYHCLFVTPPGAEPIREELRRNIGNLQIEIASTEGDGDDLPWEVLRSGDCGIPLCLAAKSFLRTRLASSSRPIKMGCNKSPCRLLLVISRPAGTQDVSYRSIASKIFAVLRSNPVFEISVLRPSTFTALAKTLRDAQADGSAFDVVHFDGHGIHAGIGNAGPSELAPGGYIVFEDEHPGEARFISGSEFGALMTECGVAAVVLNACRSARGAEDIRVDEKGRRITSFADHLVSQGVSSVIAMQYNVYVASAALYMEEFYRQLGRGISFAVAATLARKHLSSDQRRGTADSTEIDDWFVPNVFQAGANLSFRTESSPGKTKTRRGGYFPLAGTLPPAPDLGFIGSDDALLTIDRAFDHNNVVLVHGLAGAGKTATAIEFAHWYRDTNRSVELTLFSSFEHHETLEKLLASLEPFIRTGRTGSSSSSGEARAQTIQALSGKAPLWIWDNVETVERMPRKRKDELVEFLKEASRAGVKFLLTSRDSQENWFRQAATGVRMPPLRLSECIDFAVCLARRLGSVLGDLADVQPILEYSQGNPLVLTVALRTFLYPRGPSTDSAELFVERLQAGEGLFDESVEQGRSRSLLASLEYGFNRAFNDTELRVLALLYLFRSYANTNILLVMGHRPTAPENVGLSNHDFSWTLSELEGHTPDSLEAILVKAARLGLLTRSKQNHYWLHPAIQMHLKRFFDRFYATRSDSDRVKHAFAETIGVFAIMFTVLYSQGSREKSIDALSQEEDNLHHALTLSHTNGWWQAEIGALHGLFTLLSHQGRFQEWDDVFLQVSSDFISVKLGPIDGREKWWSFVMDHCLRVVYRVGDLKQAESIARRILRWERAACRSIKKKAVTDLGPADRKKLQFLGIAVGRLADIKRDMGDPECLRLNRESIRIYRTLQDRAQLSVRLFNLGHVFKNVPQLRNLDEAAKYYTEAYKSYPEHDYLARAQCLGQLGALSLARLENGVESGLSERQMLRHLNDSVHYYEDALRMIPSDALIDLARVHNQLGAVLRFSKAEHLRAVDHFKKAIALFEVAQEWLESAIARVNVAQMLAILSRKEEAQEFVKDAIAIFESVNYSGRYLQHARKLIGKGGRIA